MLLSVKNLAVGAPGQKILDGVNLDVARGEICGIAGGSGSGKTTLALAILGLLPPAMRITGGQVLLEGRDLASCSGGQMRAIRGQQIGTVFQEPLSAFDPLFTVGQQMEETLAAHTRLNARARRERCLDVLREVEAGDPPRVHRSFPHQLSGGQRQRAMIAQAIVCGPKIILADEPTSSLDVIIQAKIMDLLRRLNRERRVTIILISHDLDMLKHLAHKNAVMAKGRILETGP